jgi:ParB family chromosome partitioning protein
MRMPWNKAKVEQRDLVDEANDESADRLTPNGVEEGADAAASSPAATPGTSATEGLPLLVSVDCLAEDPHNPRTEFPAQEIAELAQDIALRGILQPIVVRRLADDGRYQVLFGAKRLRAAKQAGLEIVPVIIGAQTHDAYAQVAENQKRHGLTAIDLARFMRSRVDAGESNAEIARQMGIDPTTVAHHLALLSLPPKLDEALRSGRCTSPRTLYELAKLIETKPERVKSIISREGEITRRQVASLKKAPRPRSAAPRRAVGSRRPASLVSQASDLCARLESLVIRMTQPDAQVASDELAALRRRLMQLASE